MTLKEYLLKHLYECFNSGMATIRINHAIDLIEKFNIPESEEADTLNNPSPAGDTFIPGIEAHIKPIVDKSKKLIAKCKIDEAKATDIIRAIQNMCGHDYEETNQTPYYNRNICKICGHEWRI